MTAERMLRFDGFLSYQYDGDNTEDKLLKLADEFIEFATDWAEEKGAELFMYGPSLDRDTGSAWSNDDDDEFSYAGGLMTEEDYAERGTRWNLTNDEE